MMSEHLTDDALSAALDGEIPDGDHLASCAVCAARRDRMAAGRAALRDIAPLDELTRRRLITAALDAPPARKRAGLSPARGLAIAAAVVALLAAAAVPVLLTRGDGSHTTAASGPSRALGDLGSIDDPGVLQRELAARGVGRARLGTAGGSVESQDAKTGADAFGAPAAPSGASAPAQRSVAPSSAALSPSGPLPATDADVARCRRAQARHGRLVFSGTIVFRGTPAVVLGYQPRHGDRDRRVVIVAAARDCTVLNDQVL
jgi:hypothetical protein